MNISLNNYPPLKTTAKIEEYHRGDIVTINTNIKKFIQIYHWPKYLVYSIGLVGEIHDNWFYFNDKPTYLINFTKHNFQFIKNNHDKIGISGKPGKCVLNNHYFPYDTIEYFDETPFKYSEKVILSNDKINWMVSYFMSYSPNGEFAADDGVFKYCVKFKGNEHLIQS